MTVCVSVCAGFWVWWWFSLVGGCCVSYWPSWSCAERLTIRKHSLGVKEGMSWWTSREQQSTFHPKKKKWWASTPEETEREDAAGEQCRDSGTGVKREESGFLEGTSYSAKWDHNKTFFILVYFDMLRQPVGFPVGLYICWATYSHIYDIHQVLS